MIGLVALIGILIVVWAKPLARVGESSGAVLLGEAHAPTPARADALVVWTIRFMGLFVLFLWWLA